MKLEIENDINTQIKDLIKNFKDVDNEHKLDIQVPETVEVAKNIV